MLSNSASAAIAAGGTGPITLNGGNLNEATVYIANTITNIGTNTWTISGSGNVQPSSALTGGGKLFINPTCSGQFTPAGDWSGFTGTIVLTGSTAQCQLRLFGSNTGSAAAAFDLGTNTGKILQPQRQSHRPAGSLTGGAGTTLSGASAIAAPTTYVVGALNADSTFRGKIMDDASFGSTALRKIGTGTFTLTGTNSYSGGTTVSNGVLLVNNIRRQRHGHKLCERLFRRDARWHGRHQRAGDDFYWRHAVARQSARSFDRSAIH